MKRAIIILLLIGALGGAAWQWGPALWQRFNAAGSAEAADPSTRFFEVTQRTLVIDYTATGSLQAVKHHRVQMEQEKQSQATVLWLLDEGTEVKENQEILNLDPQPIRERIEPKENELKVANNLVPLKESWLQFERSYAKARSPVPRNRCRKASIH